MFSPRARGCSCAGDDLQKAQAVFPACAGMFLPILTWFAPLVGFPRVRGDVPTCLAMACAVSRFSPRARGCSVPLGDGGFTAPVFPACAGMFHRPGRLEITGTPFSPRARGCSGKRQCRQHCPLVFPACAGMFL